VSSVCVRVCVRARVCKRLFILISKSGPEIARNYTKLSLGLSSSVWLKFINRMLIATEMKRYVGGFVNYVIEAVWKLGVHVCCDTVYQDRTEHSGS